MRLDFNILWVEDQQEYVMAQHKRIELLLLKEGFRLRVVFASSVNEAMTFLSDSIYGDHIDLILMDYDLGASTRGDDGLVEVRNLFPFRDIIFYSDYVPGLEEKVATLKVQGVYCSTRGELPNTVQGVFESLVQKVLDIDHSRGIVMGATSDIDYCVNNCLIAIFDSCDSEEQSKTLSVVKKHMGEKRKGFDKMASKVEAVEHLRELLDKQNIYTSNDRIRLLTNAFDIKGIHKEKSKDLKEYLENTVPKRNDLAHVRVEVDGFSRKLKDRNGNEFTIDKMKALRLELVKYQDLFEALSHELGC